MAQNQILTVLFILYVFGTLIFAIGLNNPALKWDEVTSSDERFAIILMWPLFLLMMVLMWLFAEIHRHTNK